MLFCLILMSQLFLVEPPVRLFTCTFNFSSLHVILRGCTAHFWLLRTNEVLHSEMVSIAIDN